ncbi:hypothetical protein CC78DRAFT_578145 [Lojkania enalia]|uniref:Uncharacterized protein n=1 Tax=Lojkania enalia TaxID=147567 RepID=A0A9P4KD25_9PLEO|nr:hypothetical protein CC78DRAFT_578145 [Didymosphaeria enalia]
MLSDRCILQARKWSSKAALRPALKMCPFQGAYGCTLEATFKRAFLSEAVAQTFTLNAFGGTVECFYRDWMHTSGLRMLRERRDDIRRVDARKEGSIQRAAPVVNGVERWNSKQRSSGTALLDPRPSLSAVFAVLPLLLLPPLTFVAPHFQRHRLRALLTAESRPCTPLQIAAACVIGRLLDCEQTWGCHPRENSYAQTLCPGPGEK